MKSFFWLNARLTLVSVIALTGLAGPVAAKDQIGRPVKVEPVPAENTAPWLYINSDVPQEKAWTFGVLSNGLRYAVRRNGVPPGQVSIRIRIDAGSLMEEDSEQGFAHFLEHLSFRGSKYVPEGESKRIWQRFGATFGSDSNATTTPTETVYKLDLPNASFAGLDESIKILAGMMDAPNIVDATVNAERAVVMAEQREQFGPSVMLGDVTRNQFFAGQKLAMRSPIGTSATLAGATATALTVFHNRWYRPERAVVVIAGDVDPATTEALIKKHFEAWKGVGPAPGDPDFGVPDPKAPVARAMVEPSFPTIVQMGIMRPWAPVADTIIYNQGLMVDAIAERIINRRLETRARLGGSFLQAEVDQQDVSRSADMTSISLVPIGDDWQAALRDVRGVIAQATNTAPTQADIDREVSEFDVALLTQLENEGAEPGAKQADDLVRAVDIHETVTTAQGALDIFRSTKPQFTPENILASTKRLFSGVGPRIVLSTPKPFPRADALLTMALAEDASKLIAQKTARHVTFADLPKLGTPGTVLKRTRIGTFPIETVELSNGVKLILFPNAGEPGKIYVTARFGNGYKALPRNKPTVGWAGSLALVSTGIGDLNLEELDLLTNGRKINMSIDITEDAFVMGAETRGPDLTDQLKLMAAKLAAPGWDAAPIIRARAQMLAGYASMNASPTSVLTRDLDSLLRGGDPRWATPNKAEIEALTSQNFRNLWEPLLATGPIEVQIFGDFQAQEAITAALDSFGAMPARAPAPMVSANIKTGAPTHNNKPVVRTHKGPADQAAAVVAWPTGGGLAGMAESRKLDVLAAIFNDRLFDQLRSQAGASYSPSVSSQWPIGMDNGGNIVVIGQIKPESANLFFTLTRTIANDLATKPISDDELQRTLSPIIQFYQRVSTGNQFWMRQTAGVTRDPKRLGEVEAPLREYAKITPAEIQATAKRYLMPTKSWSMIVLPEKKSALK